MLGRGNPSVIASEVAFYAAKRGNLICYHSGLDPEPRSWILNQVQDNTLQPVNKKIPLACPERLIIS
jgi:hypothetical protein